MTREIAVGIDLGTTYSVLAKLDETGRPVSVVNAEGERTTPSVVLFEEDQAIVGKEALKAMATEADQVAECVKREVGYRVFHKVIGGKHYPPEVIQAWILNKLRLDAAAQIGAIEKAVITVPAYFDEVRRKATHDAGYMAGLEVLDIINEPTAAAVAFGYEQGLLHHDTEGETLRVVVYDLGGGTFDVTVMEIRGNEFITLATDGDVRLGGYDWDYRLVDIAADAFLKKHALDLREDVNSLGRLWRECEDAKRTLSARKKAFITCEHQGLLERIEVTREQFEEATQDLLDRTRFTVSETLKAAGVTWDDIDRVLLVGGSTRMPMVRRMLHEVSGREPDASVVADEAVAHGAALHAALVLARRGGDPGKFSIRNVNSHSLGVIGTDPATRRPRNGILIPRNTPIPVTAKRTFRTQKDNQRSILVRVVEGENPSPDECVHVGACTVHPLPENLPARSPIDILFAYRQDGTLKMKVLVPGAKQPVSASFTRENSLGVEHLDGWRRFISGKEPTRQSEP